MEKNTPPPVCINSTQVQLVIDKSIRTAREILRKIKKELNKKPHQPVTIHEFSEYMAIPIELIIARIS